MIESKAQVIWWRDGRALVRAEQQSSCAHCGSHSECGTSVLSKAFGKRNYQVEIVAQQPLQAGEWVVIGVPEQGLVLASLLVYILPLLGVIIGAVLGEQLASGDGMSILGAAVGMVLCLIAARVVLQMTRHRKQLEPAIVRQLGNLLDMHG